MKGGPVPSANNSFSVQTSTTLHFDRTTYRPRDDGPDLPERDPAPVRSFECQAGRALDARTSQRRKPDQWAGVHARMALDARTRTDAFRLRHLCYASKGYIDVRDSGLFCDEYDTEAGNTTMVVYDREQPVGAVRVCTMTTPARPDMARDLPVAQVFPAECAQVLLPGMHAVEINRLVTHPDHAQNLGLVFVLMRLSGYIIGKYNPDFVMSCVRDNHVPFYKRLQFEQVAGPRLYTGLKFMTNFMVARQERYDVVRRTVPVLDLSAEVEAKYDRMWDGVPVAVFDSDTYEKP